MTQFGLTEAQAQAILEMQLRRLAALERQRIENEYQELQKRIADLEALLGNPMRVLAVIKTETADLRKAYGNDRRTQISDEEARDNAPEELVAHADAVVTLSDRGYLKRLPIEAYRLQKRAGKGVRGQETREGDAIQQLLVSDTHDWLLFFTDRGRVYRERVFNVKEDATRQTRGTPVQNLIAINPAEEMVTALVAISDLQADRYIVMATKRGEVKRMDLGQFSNIRSNGLAAFDLEKGDQLLGARLADPGMRVIMITRNGKAAHFELDDVRVRATRGAGGVRGIRLIDDDEVVGMDVATTGAQLLLLTAPRVRQADGRRQLPHDGPRRAGGDRAQDHRQDRPHRRRSHHGPRRGGGDGRLGQGDSLPHRHQGYPHARARHARRPGHDQALGGRPGNLDERVQGARLGPGHTAAGHRNDRRSPAQRQLQRADAGPAQLALGLEVEVEDDTDLDDDIGGRGRLRRADQPGRGASRRRGRGVALDVLHSPGDSRRPRLDAIAQHFKLLSLA